MKKAFLIGMFLMLMSLLPVALAEPVMPVDAQGEEIMLSRFAVCQGQILAYSGVSKQLYAIDDEEATAYDIVYDQQAVQVQMKSLIEDWKAAGYTDVPSADPSGTKIWMSDGETVLALTMGDGRLFRLALDQGQAAMTAVALLDLLPETKQAGDVLFITSAAMDAQAIYAIVQVQKYSSVAPVHTALYAFDRETYARREIPLNLPAGYFANGVTTYREGSVLVSATPQSNTAASRIFVASATEGGVRPLAEERPNAQLPASQEALAYDAAADRIYFVDANVVYGLAGQEACMPLYRLTDYRSDAALAEDGALLVLGRRFHRVTPGKALVITPLKILTENVIINVDPYNEALMDIDVLVTDTSTLATSESIEDRFSKAMTMQSDQWDIFVLPISRQTAAAAQKGFCVPITGVEAFTQRLYPFVAEQVLDGQGALLMLPVQVTRRYALCYDTAAAALLGIDEAELPATYAELFEFIHNWEADYGDLALRHDISLFENSVGRAVGTLRERLLQDALALAFADRQALIALADELGALLDATIPLGRAVSDVVEPHLFYPMDDTISSTEPPEQAEAPGFLFTLAQSALPSSRVERSSFRYRMNTKPLEISLAEGTPPVAIYAGYAMVVNPYGQHVDAALRYARASISSMGGTLAADLLQQATPVPSMYMLTYRQSQQAIAETLANPADPADQAAVERQENSLSFWRRQMAAMEPFLYDVTEDCLTEYAASLAVTLPVWMDVADATAPCEAVWKQFLEGGATGQAVIRRVLEVSSMIQRE